MMQKKGPKIIIQGITEDGKKFRPSDWAERIGGNLSTFKNHRIYYSPKLRPSFINGNKCIVVDPSLQDSNPELYKYIMNFAERNKLRICGEEEEGDKNEDN